ncbi:hypothetical protein ACFYZN_07710 [Streptomyces sp. NPDC001777]|uniref:hypothetical protein n=1 Tax=Streptomyces sp. NPDC001777 TaxID=3364608 RepID=UPI0036AF8114
MRQLKYPAEGRWSFSYDEDDFVIANHPGFNDSINEAVSNYLDDARKLPSVEWLLSEWEEISKQYPEEPNGVAFNATMATLSDAGKVAIRSQYDQFDTITLPEVDFLSAVRDFRDFLSSSGKEE